MTDSLFDENVDENKNYFEELVGEGKRYKTPEDLAKGKAEADRFIAQLRKEKDDAMAELRSRITLEEALAKLQGNRPAEQPEQGTTPAERPSLTEEDIFNKLEQKLNERDKSKTESENLNQVRAALRENNVTQDDIKSKAAELGLTEDETTVMAKARPKAFLALFGVGRPRTNDLLPSGVRDTGRQGTQGAIRGKSYYDNLRKTDRNNYYSVATQLQQERDILSLGYEKFNSL